MKTRPLGASGLDVSEFGLGCARIGGIFQAGDTDFVGLLDVARGLGITFFDTSDMYSQGESERLIGRAFRGRRHEVVIATKAGYVLPRRRQFAGRIKPLLRPIIRRLGLKRGQLSAAVGGQPEQNFTPKYLRKALEGSLKRLRTDYADLFQLHSPPLEIVERGEWHDIMVRLKHEGKIRAYGVSCDSIDVGLAALRFAGLGSIQVVLSLLEPSASRALLPTAREHGVGGIARECLANGLLVKAAHEIDVKKYCRSPEEEQKRVLQLEEFRADAQSRGISFTRSALEYVRNVDGVSVALVGASSRAQLEQLLRHMD
jgi:aryl-alcohol dehydrogenase-like predicted oxidoreductase